MSMGVDKFVKKPAPIQEIIRNLDEVIRRGPRPLEPEAHRELDLAKLYNETLVNKLEQKNVELSEQAEALRASEEKFRQLAENINEFCWISNAETMETLYASPAYEKIWGRSCQSLYDNALSFLEGVPEGDRAGIRAGMESMKRGEPMDLEHRVIHPDGSPRWVHARGSGVRNEKGEIYRLVGICEDITRRRSTEDQLRQAQKMEAIGQLAGGVAHDFNNLLTIIGANLDLVIMTEENLSPGAKDYLSHVSHAADRAATLTRQLLAFSRSEAMHVQVVNLNELISTFTKLLGRILGEDVRLVSDFAPNMPPVKVDAGMIEQVLMNLSVNARDAMTAGGRLTIRTELQTIDAAHVEANPRARSGRFACISVEDIGTGIAPEHMSRIFEPFFTTKGVGKGT
ncbi:MAG TPA: PAS domain-containing protein, partial [Verrucomicrobiae bacterium]|nr:PAS domain-containing protein [Verrucomicrobiae bacterium]